MSKILILGGTREAAQLARKLINDGHDVTSSLAGRTKEPKPLDGNVRIGGFGGVDGLADYLIKHRIEQLIDATHPFAHRISANALAAAKQARVPLEIHSRQPWQRQSDDEWIYVDSLEEARDALPSGARVLLALGRQYIDVFRTREDVFFLVRMVDQPDLPPPLPNHKLLLGKPSLHWEDEAAILKAEGISHIVCRNSGGNGAYAKIEAARDLEIPVIMIKNTGEKEHI